MSIVLTSPLDLIRTKLYSQYLTYPELGRCLRSGFQAEGVFSLWRGVGSTILRDVPYASEFRPMCASGPNYVATLVKEIEILELKIVSCKRF